MTSPYILDVSEADFEYEVIAHSQEVPVVVDFWAEWCAPCRMLGPLLERLAEQGNGSFRLAKVDVDANPNLALRYNVRGIPAVKAFRDNQIVAEFTGAQPEPIVRQFLSKIAPTPSDLRVAKGNSLLLMQDWEAAEESFRAVLDETPKHPTALLGLAKAQLAQGYGEAALEILERFPPSREYAAAEKLLPLARALIWLHERDPNTDDPLEAAYATALRLISLGNIPAAMDGLLEILRKDKRFREDEARKVMLALFEILGEDSELTREYRAELASVLF